MTQNGEMNRDPDNGPKRLPNVIVKFHNWVELPPYKDNLQDDLVKTGMAPWADLEKDFPGITIQRVFITLSPEEIQEFEDRAFDKEDPERPHLLRYFQIDAPRGTDREALAERIRKWDIVELAYVPLTLVSPDPPTHKAAAQGFQVHLTAAQASIGAEAAWQTASGDGRNMRFIDMERGWLLNHQNLKNSVGSPIFTVVDPATSQVSTDPIELSHGASVLGTIAAPDYGGPTMQTIGIAFKSSGQVISIDRIPTGGGNVQENINDAITVAWAALSEGDVILIEAQAVDSARKLWPVERNKLEFDVIHTATNPNNNRVVIEAAGNGTDIKPAPPNGTEGNNLDQFISTQFTMGLSLHIFDRGSGEFRDSGAIMVGSATSTPPHYRMTRTGYNSESNFGKRVDCYAWGQDIFTTGGPNTTDYDLFFGSTSGASAIIAGAALLIQGLAKAHQKGDNLTNRTYLPETLRKILGSFDPLTNQPWRQAAPNDTPPYGTKSNNPATDLIGVMPDLKKIIENYMGLAPGA
jgi:subtilase family protein